MFNRSFHNLFMKSMIVGAALLANTSAYAEERNLVTGNQANIPTATCVPPRNAFANFGDNCSETTIVQTPKTPAINSDATVPQTNSQLF